MKVEHDWKWQRKDEKKTGLHGLKLASVDLLCRCFSHWHLESILKLCPSFTSVHFLVFFLSAKCQITIFEMTVPQILQLLARLRRSASAGKKNPRYVCNTSWKLRQPQGQMAATSAASCTQPLWFWRMWWTKRLCIKIPDWPWCRSPLLCSLKQIQSWTEKKTKTFYHTKRLQEISQRSSYKPLFFCVLSSVLWSRAEHQGYKF